MSGGENSHRRDYTRLTSRRRVTIPAGAVHRAGLVPGDELRVEIDRAGRIVMSKQPDVDRRLRAIAQLEGRFTGVWESGEIDQLRGEWR